MKIGLSLNRGPGRLRCRLGAFLLAVAVATALAVGVTQARAVVVAAAPTWPISNASAGSPPIPALPAAGDTAPPADQIADPVTPAASCGGWYLQSSYGGRWPAGSSWWEYRCTYEYYLYYTPCSGGGACDAFCPSCYVEIEDRTDYFYWNGSDPVFYGQDYFYDFYYTETFDFPPSMVSAWWDAPTARWYNLAPLPLTVSTAGTGSGAVVSSPAGISCGYSCQASFDAGTVVTLTATPDASSSFTGWAGDCSGTGSCEVTMDQSHSVTATFAAKAFNLAVPKMGSGSGVVMSSPAGIGCGDICQASFDASTVVTLTATPDASSIFIGWSGDCSGTGGCQVAMDRFRSVTATFAAEAFTLTVSRVGTGSGAVTSSPAGIGCGDGCQASFGAGTAVTLTATPAAGSLFTGWTGDCSGTGGCQLTMDQARSVTATFALNAPPRASFSVTCTGLTCTFNGEGSTDPEGSTLAYAWDFGDGASGNGKTVPHSYGHAGRYTVTLTVTDTAGATGSDSQAINPISLSARGYKQNGQQKADLSWNGAAGTSFDVYRDGTKIAAVQATAYTDVVPKGAGGHSYRVCASVDPTCSNEATVSF
jgi:PKD repeat protein